MVLEKSGKRSTLSPAGMLFAEKKSILNEADALEIFILLIAKKEKKINEIKWKKGGGDIVLHLGNTVVVKLFLNFLFLI